MWILIDGKEIKIMMNQNNIEEEVEAIKIMMMTEDNFRIEISMLNLIDQAF